MASHDERCARLFEIVETLESEIRALTALSRLLNGCSNRDGVMPSELTYLLDPIIERERSLVNEAHDLLFGRDKPPAVEA
jgi:hypothetical protein